MPVLNTTGGNGAVIDMASPLGISDFPFTIAAWVRAETAQLSEVAGFGHETSAWNYHRAGIRLPGGFFRATAMSRTANGTPAEAANSTTLSLNTWHPIVWTWPANNLRRVHSLAVENVGQSTASRDFTGSGNSLNAAGARFAVGRRGNSTVELFDGQIAHVAVWNKQLSDAEITAFMEGGNPITIANDNLRAYWGEDFFEDGGTTYYEDLSGNDYHLELLSGATVDTTTTPPEVDAPPTAGLSFTTPPSVTGRTSTSYTLEGTLSEQGQVHAVAVAHDDGTPSIAQIVAGQRSNGSAAPGAGNTTTTGAGNFTLTVSGSGVAAAPSHDIHYVGRAPE